MTDTPPVLEHGFIQVREQDAAAFETAYAQAKTVLARSPGFRFVELHRGVERPDMFLLLVGWDTLEDHVDGFRGSDLFTQWRALISPYFVELPVVEHFRAAADRFTG